jgi:LmbE family N-acetylglucosaminyl deacetylase
MKKSVFLFSLFMSVSMMLVAQSTPLRILVIGAHPDDCDLLAGGTAALYASKGHAVKFVSLTNGDKGHQQMRGAALAQRRLKEAKEAGRRIGVAYEVLDTPDGELLPTLENRYRVIRLIRDWKADVVISHRPNTYHPDHRYTGVLVLDAAYMVIVPAMLDSVAPLEKNPLFLYMSDGFQRPNPFRPDIVVDITPVVAQKTALLDAHASQFYEWLPWTVKKPVPQGTEERKKWLAEWRVSPSELSAEAKQNLEKWYGKPLNGKAAHVESFEICEYGRGVDEAEIRRLFPMFKQQ